MAGESCSARALGSFDPRKKARAQRVCQTATGRRRHVAALNALAILSLDHLQPITQGATSIDLKHFLFLCLSLEFLAKTIF